MARKIAPQISVTFSSNNLQDLLDSRSNGGFWFVTDANGVPICEPKRTEEHALRWFRDNHICIYGVPTQNNPTVRAYIYLRYGWGNVDRNSHMITATVENMEELVQSQNHRGLELVIRKSIMQKLIDDGMIRTVRGIGRFDDNNT